VAGVDEVAEAVLRAVTDEAFLVLPHPQVGKFWASKAAEVEDRSERAMSARAKSKGRVELVRIAASASERGPERAGDERSREERGKG
jgi:hypothetical protein